MSVRLKAQRPGFSQLIVTYQYKDILLKASVTIGAYLPLQVGGKFVLVCLIEDGTWLKVVGRNEAKVYLCL